MENLSKIENIRIIYIRYRIRQSMKKKKINLTVKIKKKSSNQELRKIYINWSRCSQIIYKKVWRNKVITRMKEQNKMIIVNLANLKL